MKSATIDKTELSRRTEIVVKNLDGIIPYCEIFYIYSIHYSANRSLNAFDRFHAAASSNASAAMVVSTIQEALGHAAALSRFFWPSRDKGVAKARAKKLRRAFELNDDSPLKNRTLRDALEHFDERLDEYLLENASGDFRPAPIVGSHDQADDPVARIFKLVDLDANIFVLLGKKYEFTPVITEVNKIFTKATHMAHAKKLDAKQPD